MSYYNKIINEEFPNHLKIEKLSKGHINHVFKITLIDKILILKFFNNNFKYIINKKNLPIIYKKLNDINIGPKLIKINDKYLIEEFIEGNIISKKYFYQEINNIVYLLKQIHKIKINQKYNFFESIENINNNFKINFEKDIILCKDLLLKIKKKVKTDKLFDIVLCHQDLYWGNIIKVDNKLKCIDYDFCNETYRAVDIAFIIYFTSIYDNNFYNYFKIRDHILMLYFQKISLDQQEIINYFVMLLTIKNILIINKINKEDLDFYNDIINERIKRYNFFKKYFLKK